MSYKRRILALSVWKAMLQVARYRFFNLKKTVKNEKKRYKREKIKIYKRTAAAFCQGMAECPQINVDFTF